MGIDKEKLKKIGYIALSLIAVAGLAVLTFYFCVSAPVAAWSKLAGSSSDDFGYACATDSKGSVYIAGSSAGSIAETPNMGYRDAVVLKYDSGGARLWARQFGSSAWDEAYSVAVGPKGEVYVAGYTIGGMDGNANYGKYDLFISKFDPDGNRLWSRQMGTPENDYAYSVVVDSKGDAYVAGYTYGGIDGLAQSGGADFFLVKFDSEGKKLWSQQMGTPSDDVAYSAAIDPTGGVLVSGYTGGSLDGGLYAGNWDAFVMKFDADGRKLWSRQLGTSSWDEAWAVGADKDGNAYVTGYTGGRLDGRKGKGAFDMFLAKFDSRGEKKWVRLFGTSENDYARALALDAKGRVYVAGYSEGGFDRHKNEGGADVFVAGFSKRGRMLWSRQTGSKAGDFSFAVALDPSGNVFIAGETSGGVGGNAAVNGGFDAYGMKFNASETGFKWSRVVGFYKDALRKSGFGG